MKSAFDALDGLQVRLAIPDLWQQEAVRHLQSGADVIVDAPTGAGKTFVFEQAVGRGNHPRHGEQAVFTVPTRALANDKWREWKADGWKVGLATGDLAVDLDAPVLVAQRTNVRKSAQHVLEFLTASGAPAAPAAAEMDPGLVPLPSVPLPQNAVAWAVTGDGRVKLWLHPRLTYMTQKRNPGEPPPLPFWVTRTGALLPADQ